MLNNTSKIQHCYIVGQTGSGKSYLAKQIAREHRMAGWPVYVASAKAGRRNADGRPKQDVIEWKKISGAILVTDDAMLIAQQWDAGKLPPSVVVFDEGSVDLGNNPEKVISDMFKLSRDDKIKIILLSQNYKRVAKQIRDNCGELRLFGCSSDDLSAVRADYSFGLDSERIINQANQLDQYEHLYINPAQRLCTILTKERKVKNGNNNTEKER